MYSEDSGTRPRIAYLAVLWLAVPVPIPVLVPDSGGAGREIWPLPGLRGLVYKYAALSGLDLPCGYTVETVQYGMVWIVTELQRVYGPVGFSS